MRTKFSKMTQNDQNASIASIKIIILLAENKTNINKQTQINNGAGLEWNGLEWNHGVEWSGVDLSGVCMMMECNAVECNGMDRWNAMQWSGMEWMHFGSF